MLMNAKKKKKTFADSQVQTNFQTFFKLRLDVTKHVKESIKRSRQVLKHIVLESIGTQTPLVYVFFTGTHISCVTWSWVGFGLKSTFHGDLNKQTTCILGILSIHRVDDITICN